ncbi:diguanylate cyclase [Roseomonas hellenica]|uniref:diguanylate cyclase n=1 Tax=Plastoroseomonas hellenica TaxID=2687306 RepID=A0ABS5FA33_9PROT|nr:diguanylate cyclase [Plastoroseomonas hellenica]
MARLFGRGGSALLLGALLAAGVLVTVAAVLLDSRRDAWDRAREASANLARAVERDLTSEIKAIDLTLRAVSDIMMRAGADEIRPELRRELVLERVRSTRYLDAIVLLDDMGEVIFDTRQRAPSGTGNHADRDFFAVHRDHADAGLHISRPYRSRLGDGLWSIGFSRRLSHPDGSFAGIAVGAIRLSHLQAVFEGMQLGSRGAMTLVRDDGIVLARHPHDERLLGRDLSGAAPFRRMRGTQDGQFVSTASTDQVQRFYTFRTLDDLPIVFNVALAVSDIYETWWEKAVVIGSVTIVLVVTMLLMMMRLGRELRRRRDAEQVARRNEATFRLLAENSSDMVSRLDLSGRRLYVSPSAERIFGRPAVELIGCSPLEHIAPQDRGAAEASMTRLRAGAKAVLAEYRILRPDGETVWVEASASTIINEATGEPEGIVAVIRDVTERKMLEEDLARLARTDGLTGLANRRAFDGALASEWLRARREQTPLSLLLIDVDHFKLFNDTYGHPQGDDCLRKVASAAAGVVRRPADLVARYGGEEIAILLPNTPPAGAALVAEEVRAAVEAIGLTHEGNPPSGVVTVSIGLAAALSPANFSDPMALVSASDAALYRAKRAGRNRVIGSPPAPIAPAESPSGSGEQGARAPDRASGAARRGLSP